MSFGQTSLASILVLGLGACAHSPETSRGSQNAQTPADPSSAVEIDAPPPDGPDAPPRATADAPPRRAGEGLTCNESGDQAAAKRLFKVAQRHFKEGDHQQAALRFVEAYRVSCKALLLYNAARAYQLMGDRDAAIDALQAGLERAESDRQRQQFEQELKRLRGH